jgi:hypothetical protein
MVLVRETSAGRIALSFSQLFSWQGVNVQVSRVDEAGWGDELDQWSQHQDKRPLEDFLIDVAGVSRSEATGLAADGLDAWTTRHDPDKGAGRLEFYGRPLLYVTIVLVALALVAAQIF